MASSDEEGEILPEYVTNYHFVDDKDTHVSFSILPVQWDENEAVETLGLVVYLRGEYDSGLQKIFKRVVAWKFELSHEAPEIFVLSKDKNWIMLQKPRKICEDIFRSVLITVHCLHFMKNNPDASELSMWNHLLETFRSYEVAPSGNDLLNHMSLIGEAARRDNDLATSKSFLTFAGTPHADIAFHEDVGATKKYKFIVDEDEDDDDTGAGKEVGENELAIFDTVCAICDDGGEIFCCDGWCLRSFHATIEDGMDSKCESLGYRNNKEVAAIQNFVCENCLHQQHQCFACGRLGCSAKSSSQEVFPCVSATCGHFFHPDCVAKLLHGGNETQAKEFRDKITAGESFTCPAHKCFVCKKGEDKDNRDLQFAMCRRCPKAYHRKCLPSNIVFGHKSNENMPQRAWEGLLPNQRILIYCMDHEIDRQLKTPARNHLIFPGAESRKKKCTSELLSTTKAVLSNRRIVSEHSAVDLTAVKKPKRTKILHGVEKGDSTKSIERTRSEQDFEPSKKPTIIDTGRKYLKDNISSVSDRASANKSKSHHRNNMLMNLGTYPLEAKQQKMADSKIKHIISDKTVMKEGDTEMENRIMALMKKATSSFDAGEFTRKYDAPATYAHCSQNVLDKSVTLGLVEGSVKAVRTALQKLEQGCSIEDAKAVCEPEILRRIFGWQKKLEVYLAPFLHGMRYTSFGRHFTQVEKLKEIVDRLHWYVKDGDTIVDFCCGSNDFSCLMKEKLEKAGKLCSFKNYDLIQAKNDFCFEKRDWMTVNLQELPDGSRLIMGLNPPFGVNSSLANAFIDRALKFKPKLIVLIVPKETKRLDKKAPYDLIWEDDALLSGESFYLPGSVDVDGKQMADWNQKPPPLYLWSRADWTARHIATAQEHGHISKEQDGFENLMEGNHYCCGHFSGDVCACSIIPSTCDGVPEDNGKLEPEGTRTTVPIKQGESHFVVRSCIEDWENDCMSKDYHENLNEMQYQRKGQIESLPLETQDGAIAFEADDMSIDMEISPINSPNICFDIQSILEDEPPEACDTSGMVTREEGFQDLQPRSSFHDLEIENERVETAVSADIPQTQKVEVQFNGHINEMHNGTPTHPWPQPHVQP